MEKHQFTATELVALFGQGCSVADLAGVDKKHLEALYALAVAVEQTQDYLEAIGLYFNILSLGYRKKGLSSRLKTCILGLSKTNLKQALEFANGWVKNFPDNKTAQKTLNQLKQ